MNMLFILILIPNLSLYKLSKEISKKCLSAEIPSYIQNVERLPGNGFIKIKKPDLKNIDFLPQDIIVGDTPHETLLVNYPFELYGNIFVINDGVLILDSAQLTIHGMIYGTGMGKILVDSSVIHFPQVHIYQYGIFLADSSYMDMRNSRVYGNFMPLNMMVTHKAKANWRDNDLSQSFFTTVLFGNAEIWIYNAQLPGEYLMFDSVNAHFKNIDSLLIWFHFPESSYVDFEFPPWGWLYNFVFDSTLPGVSEISYHVDVDSSFYVMWGLFPAYGCDATINNSEIRTIGIFFNHTTSDTLQSLVNESYYSNFTLPLNDRNFTLNNTYVHTWSLYPQDTAFVELSYSIVGEVLSMGNSFMMSHNYFLDGSGGHLEASGNSLNFVYLTSLSCDVISTEMGIQVLYYTSQIYGNIWATDSSRLFILQSEYSTEPIPHDASYLMVGKIDYLSSYYVGDTIRIFGDAYADGGPLNPSYNLDHYTLHYQPPNDTNWYFIGYYNSERKHDTLGIWNTQGLQSGGYNLKLTLYSNIGDTMECQKWFNLYPVGVKEANLTIPDVKESEIIYDICGRKISFLKNSKKNFVLPRGIYFIKKAGRVHKAVSFK